MSAKELVEACKKNLFPSTATVTLFGLDGNNPVEILACYRCAVVDGGVTAEDIENNYDDLSNFILKRTESVRSLECYASVLEAGGIRLSAKLPQRECPKCRMCTAHRDGMCINCGTHLKV